MFMGSVVPVVVVINIIVTMGDEDDDLHHHLKDGPPDLPLPFLCWQTYTYARPSPGFPSGFYTSHYFI